MRNHQIKKLSITGVLSAFAVVGSLFYSPVFGALFSIVHLSSLKKTGRHKTIIQEKGRNYNV